MQVLLRCMRTKRYLTGEGDWTSDRLGARDFRSGPQAMLFAREKGLVGVELLLAFEDPRYDIAVPLREPGSSAQGSLPL